MNDAISQRDHGIREISASRPKFRQNLRYSCRELRGEILYQLEDPLTGKFYHLGESEYAFCRLLDGKTTLSQAVSKLASLGSELAFSEAIAQKVLRRYQDAGLIETSSEDHSARKRDHKRTKQDTSQIIGKGRSLLMLKIPLGSPNEFFTKLAQCIHPIRGGWFFSIWLIVVISGAVSIGSQRDRFALESEGVLQIDNALLLGIIWLFLKVVHEFFHGITCRRFGGVVPEAGITLLLLITPLGYVDATSSLGFASKGRRILVAGAGMLGELFVASIAAIVWSVLDPGPLGSVLHQIIIISSVTTILFNANPLMRFDGYYILSDILEIPNLSQKGSRAAKWLFNRIFLGVKKAPFPMRANDQNDPRLLLTAYGVAAAFWKVLVTVGLMVGAAFLFQGAGLILAIIVGLAMLANVVQNLYHYLKHSGSGGELSPVRVTSRIAFILIAIALLSFLPVRPGFKAPGIVEPIEGGLVRVDCPGFVTKVAMTNGAMVKKGDLLLTLANPEASVELKEMQLESIRIRRFMALYQEREEIASWQSEQRNLIALEERLVEMEQWLESLTLRAPIDGIVDVNNLDALRGNYLRTGDIVLSIIANENKLLRLVVPQDHIELASASVGRPLKFRAMGAGLTGHAKLNIVQPQATMNAPHSGLTTVGGGPLVVRRVNATDTAQNFELLEPHFLAKASLSPENARELREGQLVWTRLQSKDTQPLWQSVRKWAQDAMQNLVDNRS